MRRECLDDVWDELRQCIAFFDLRGISDEDVEDILTQKFQLLNASHKDETYNCLDALPTTRLERTALCFARVLDLIQTSPSMSNKFWKTLSKVVDKRAMHRTVLATIDLCMSKVSALAKVTGSAPTDDQSPLSKGLLAAKVYLMWLHIPGGSAYSIFMPFVYQDALWVLLGWAKVMYAPELEEQASKTARAGQTKRKQAKKPSYVASTELAEYGKDVLTILVSLGSMQSFNLDAVTSTLDAIVSIAALMAVQAVPAEECRQILKALYPNHAQQVLVRLMPALAFRDKSLPGGARDIQQHMTAFHVWSLETSDQLLGSHGNDDANAMNAMVVLQQLCIRSPEKTDYRKKVAAALVTLFFHHVLPHPGYTSTLMTFLDSFSRSEKVTCRQFAVEVTTQLIVHDGWTDQFSLQFGILMRRARDRSVWVRNKALVGMASVLSKALHKQASGWSPALEQVVVAELTSSKSFSDETPPIRVWTHLIQLLQMCLEDGKKMVRKSALQVLEVLLVVERDMGIVAEIQLKCTDSSVLVRKQAMHVLTTLVLKDPSNRDLHNIWSWGVLPLVNDPEPMVQTSCVDFVDQVLFQRLGEWHDYRRRGLEITHALKCVHDQFDHLDRMLITFAQVALRLLVKAGKIDVPQVIKNCIAGIQIPETTTSSWVVLDELHARLIDHVTTSDCRALTKMWNEKQDQNSLRMLRVLSSIASRVAALDASKIAKRLQVALQSFSFHMNVIPGAIHTLVRLQDDKSWQTSLWAACDEVIQDVVTNGVQDISRLQRVLCTMGDLWDGQHDQPQRLQHIQRFLLPTFNQQSTPSAVRAVAFLALGKVSLASQSIAKDSMTMFIRELQTSDNVAIRSNILLVLGDLCMQYTSMVEVYVPTIAACFMNPDVLLRRNVLLMLTQLILQGYIKWKDSLLHYFLHLVVDDDAELAHLARHVLSGPLLQKTPHLFTTKFVETIFVLNNVILPSVSAVGLVMSDAEVHALSFCGADLFPNRWKIYHFMLNTMSDFQKVDVTGKLTRGILEEVSEQKLPLHDNAKDIQDNSVERVVQDTLLVLSSSEIKLTHGGAGDDDDELEPSSMKEATRKLASKLSKKNLMVNVIPVVIGVKHQLEAKRSPVMRYLLHYIQDLMTSFKEEVMDVLNTDPQLAKEIAFDLKQYKAMKLAKSRPSLGGGPAVLPGASIVPLGVTSTPLLKKHMTPLTRILRERRASFNDYSDGTLFSVLSWMSESSDCRRRGDENAGLLSDVQAQNPAHRARPHRPVGGVRSRGGGRDWDGVIVGL
ncbi:hypothetical protein, variant [Aphanomyces invadans]|uniref:Condensin complex subunit 1 C-terminal domain-containing protein n=1 Tax=Aphanomyces invadans TaxID=157072 RepID=A0A024URP6_9STRA|nr:hypothetical protein, variant [Aphanomyces invadans]ETW08949.1 hypothetical protein, variant [Aphanomyces invadans]|eukprot:XP_008862754.1 hypothetical protein, variant [Aphanomyces invadans]